MTTWYHRRRANTARRRASRRIKASELKARCLQLMDEVAKTGEEIVITRRGRPVSRLVPCREQPEAIFGADRDVIRIHGDIVVPIWKRA